MNLHVILEELSKKRPIFHNEADFQHALAWAIRERYPEAKIRLEMKTHGLGTKIYLDILVTIAGRKYAIELKYKTRTFDIVVDEEDFALSNHGAQDIGRYDVLKDLRRLEQMVTNKVADEGFLIFLTNDSSYQADSREVKETADQEFRLHEGRVIQGTLSWSENTGKGTMEGREEPLAFHGQYNLHWIPYSCLAGKNGGHFECLLLNVRGEQNNLSILDPMSSTIINSTNTEEDNIVTTNQTTVEQSDSPQWFELFLQRGMIPLSQADLREKLASHLREEGYFVSQNRDLGKDKIDIWAEREDKTIAIEVRCKTALLQTVHQGKSIHLKNQGAQDVSRYDFISDIGKLERIVDKRPTVKGYALLVTNDAMYWHLPKKQDSVDSKFRIHSGRLLAGKCSWSKKAASGTTSGREEPICLTGIYRLIWKSYLTLGSGKNMEFQALVVEVNNVG